MVEYRGMIQHVQSPVLGSSERPRPLEAVAALLMEPTLLLMRVLRTCVKIQHSDIPCPSCQLTHNEGVWTAGGLAPGKDKSTYILNWEKTLLA